MKDAEEGRVKSHEKVKKELSEWQARMKDVWSNFAIEEVVMQVSNGQAGKEITPKRPYLKIGSKLNVRALVRLDKVSPEDVSVELYHGNVDTWGNIKDGSTVKMNYEEENGQEGEHWFVGSVPCAKTGRYGMAVRVLPCNPDMVNPYELGLILWETTAEKPAPVNAG